MQQHMTLDEIQSSFWLNDDSKKLFTAKDMVQAIAYGHSEINFASTGEYYAKVNDYIEATNNLKSENE